MQASIDPIPMDKPWTALRLLACLFACAISWCHGAACGQTVIPLDSLPPPPAELKQWIESGQMTFQTGISRDHPPAGTTEPQASSDDSPPRDADNSGRRAGLAAKTEYQIEYRCDLQKTWKWNPTSRELRITARLRRLHWQPSHKVWFRELPEKDSFWSDRLVLHEFDHVRLSCDPGMKAKFAASLKPAIVIRHKLEAGQRITPQLIDQIIDESVRQRFAEILELIDLRYEELDRATGNGRSPLSPGSPLHALLRETWQSRGPQSTD